MAEPGKGQEFEPRPGRPQDFRPPRRSERAQAKMTMWFTPRAGNHMVIMAKCNGPLAPLPRPGAPSGATGCRPQSQAHSLQQAGDSPAGKRWSHSSYQ